MKHTQTQKKQQQQQQINQDKKKTQKNVLRIKKKTKSMNYYIIQFRRQSVRSKTKSINLVSRKAGDMIIFIHGSNIDVY